MAYDAEAVYTNSTLGDNTHGLLDPTAHKNGPNGSLPVYSLPGPPSTPGLSLHSAISTYVVSPSGWEDSYLDHPSHIFGQNFEYSLSQSSPGIADFYERQKLLAGRDYVGHVEAHAPSQSNPYEHTLSGVDMRTRFEVPLTDPGHGLLQDAILRNPYGYEIGGSNPWTGLLETPDHHLHPLMRHPQTPPYRAIQIAMPFLDHDPTLHHPLTSHDNYFCSASNPNWRSTPIAGTPSDSIGETLIDPIAGPTSNGPSQGTQDSTIPGQKVAPPIAMKTARSFIGDKEAQSEGLAPGRHRGAANRSLSTVRSSSQRSTQALPYRRALCKKNLSYAPEYLRVAFSRLLKIVGKSLFVSQNILEPTIGSEPAKKILTEVHDMTGVWLRDKVSDGESIYFLFIDRTSNLSLICGHDTRTSDRALGHIRSMLDHRPFPCLGKAHGCNSKKCSNSGDRPFRFFTEALRDDHIRRQGLKDECTSCGAMIRRGGMNRHVRLIHPESASTPVLSEKGSSEKIS